MAGTLYLIPNTLGDNLFPGDFISARYASVIAGLRTFIVEDVRSARRYLSRWKLNIPIEECSFLLLNEHTTPEELPSLIQPLRNGEDVGVISEAGVPGVADPGADIVAMAHQYEIRVVPMVGPSSILLSVMASGLNGQSFAFNGYLPVKPDERSSRLKDLERISSRLNQTQLFIEAPYRNVRLMEDILKICLPSTRLCVATDLTLPTESITTRTIRQWREAPMPTIDKHPAVFLILA